MQGAASKDVVPGSSFDALRRELAEKGSSTGELDVHQGGAEN